MAELDEEQEEQRLLAWDEEPGSTKYWNDRTGTFEYPEGWPPSSLQRPVSETWLGQQLLKKSPRAG